MTHPVVFDVENWLRFPWKNTLKLEEETGKHSTENLCGLELMFFLLCVVSETIWKDRGDEADSPGHHCWKADSFSK